MSIQAQSQAGGVGALLKQSREQRGLTTAEVASQLRLKVSLIEQIEAEQWDPAVSATFIRGYLRAYAKLMKLPEQEILANFELQAAYLRNQAKPMHSFSNKASLDAVDNRFMLASYMLIVLLIGLFLIWFWQTHLLDSEPVTALPGMSVVTVTDPQALPAENDQQTAAVAENAVTAGTEQSQTLNTDDTSVAGAAAVLSAETQQTPVADAPQHNQAKPESLQQSAVPLPEQSSPANAAPVVTTTDSTAANVSTPVTTEQPANNAAAVDAQLLTLQFSAECWLEVTDANGKRLAYGTRQAGQNERLTGTAPFKVLLGNAAAAKVQLNDVAVDLSGYAAGRVARLTLGGQP